MKTVKGWWFALENNKLANGDNRPIKLEITHSVKGEIIPCQNGLHLSKRLIDALNYSPGPIVYKVAGSGVVIPHGHPIDKYVCSERTYIKGGINCTDIIIRFARLCALDVIHLWDAPEIVIEYLKTGDEKLRSTAWAAARDAAWDAADDAARAAARAAAKAAARDAARAAARAAAWAAARDAARATARAAAKATARAAARAAAKAAARATARETQNKRLTSMIVHAIKKGENSGKH